MKFFGKITIMTTVLVVLATVSACRKDDSRERDCPTEGSPLDPAEVHGHALSWKYAPGSYWVYWNDSTLAEDSIYITNVDAEIIEFRVGPHGPGQGACYKAYEEYRFTATGDFDFSGYVQYSQISLLKYPGEFAGSVDHGMLNHYDSLHAMLAFDTLTFTDVYRTTQLDGNRYYVTPGAGLVRIERPDGNRTLLRYHVSY